MDNVKPSYLCDMPVLEVLKKIKDGSLSPNMLGESTRQACVEVLFLEGHPRSSIAALFKKSDRTIRRDLEKIHKRNAIEPNAELTYKIIGEFVLKARNQFERLKQISRLTEAYPDERTRAEFLAWRVVKECIEKLSLLGFLIGSNCPSASNHKSEGSGFPVETEEQRKLRDDILNLPAMEKEKLVEKIRQDIIRVSDKIDKETEEKEKKKNSESKK